MSLMTSMLPDWICRTARGTDSDKAAGNIVEGEQCEREAMIKFAHYSDNVSVTFVCQYHAPEWLRTSDMTGWKPVEYRPDWYLWEAWGELAET